MWKALSCWIFPAAVVLAQTTGSISGVVRDATTASPLADVTVSVYVNAHWVGDTILMSAQTKQVTSTTDDRGEYKLGGLPAGSYRLSARSRDRSTTVGTKWITLAARQDLSKIDFALTAFGTIAGKVVDNNREPAPDVWVLLLAPEYYLGGSRYYPKERARTNDLGEYTLTHVEPGRRYAVIAEKSEPAFNVLSDAPANPKLRRPAFAPTYYPNSLTAEGAIPLVLRPRERRESIDIEMVRTKSYCIEGTVQAMGFAKPLAVAFTALQTMTGVSSSGGLVGMGATAPLGPDRKIRLCGLSPGRYRISAFEPRGVPQPGQMMDPPIFGANTVSITDEDVQGMVLAPGPGVPVMGKVLWDGEEPEEAVASRLLLSFMPMNRPDFPGEHRSARPTIPGEFHLESVLAGDYNLHAIVTEPGVYVKDIFYGSTSIFHRPFRPGTELGNAELRILLRHDGGTLDVGVRDRDGNPVGDANVLIMPAEAGSQAVLADLLVSGKTDQNGRFTSGTLAPGKYLVLAGLTPVDASVDRIDALYGSRAHAKEVEIGPNASAQVTLELRAGF